MRDQRKEKTQQLNHGTVLQGTSSWWIWAKCMHLNGLEDCGEQKGLTMSSIYSLACISGSTSQLYLEISSGNLEASSPSILLIRNSSKASSELLRFREFSSALKLRYHQIPPLISTQPLVTSEITDSRILISELLEITLALL